MKSGTLKVLTLGHSLALDAAHLLALIADTEGYKDMTVGTLYYPGCSLQRHVAYLTDDIRGYDLYICRTQTAKKTFDIIESVTMKEALLYDDWNVIIMQGGVFGIGEEKTYTNGDIQTIQNYVRRNRRNPDAVFAWNMTWAPPVDDDLRATFPRRPNPHVECYIKYNHDRTALYNAITRCVSDHIVTDDTFQFLIPSGTVIENALSSYLTEKDLLRDYVHATDLARVMLSYVWYCALCGVEHLNEIKLHAIPKGFFKTTQLLTDRVLTDAEKVLILESVNHALKNPLRMTQSRYTVAPATE